MPTHESGPCRDDRERPPSPRRVPDDGPSWRDVGQGYRARTTRDGASGYHPPPPALHDAAGDREGSMAQRRADDRPATRRRAYTIRDQIALRRLDSFVVSPDGALVVLQIARAARRQNRLDTALWVVNADGTRLRRLASSGGLSSPAFSPDGRSIYALSGPSTKKRQVVRLGLDGGRTTSVTQSPVDVESFVLSRDGAFVAFSAQVYPGGPDTLASTAE